MKRMSASVWLDFLNPRIVKAEVLGSGHYVNPLPKVGVEDLLDDLFCQLAHGGF